MAATLNLDETFLQTAVSDAIRNRVRERLKSVVHEAIREDVAKLIEEAVNQIVINIDHARSFETQLDSFVVEITDKRKT